MTEPESERPGPAEANNERITARPHDDFATFPPEEVEVIDRPGGGPQGTLDDGPSLPLLVVGLGLLIVFSTFVFDSGWPLGIGLVVLVAGALWTGLSYPRRGSGAGLGPADGDPG